MRPDEHKKRKNAQYKKKHNISENQDKKEKRIVSNENVEQKKEVVNEAESQKYKVNIVTNSDGNIRILSKRLRFHGIYIFLFRSSF